MIFQIKIEPLKEATTVAKCHITQCITFTDSFLHVVELYIRALTKR